MSHLTQMLGLTVHNFVSAATGLAMAFALVRGFARSSATTVGNFWADLTRITLYILLPISVVGAVLLIALGVPQTLSGSVDAATLEGAKQTIAIGPMASQEIIKELGTNGGGFFNANSAHPFENPNAWTNVIEIWAILLIYCVSSGVWTRRRRHSAGAGRFLPRWRSSLSGFCCLLGRASSIRSWLRWASIRRWAISKAKVAGQSMTRALHRRDER
jgi:K+-transporting ATPase A subunit